MTASYCSPSRLLPALNGLSVDMRLPLRRMRPDFSKPKAISRRVCDCPLLFNTLLPDYETDADRRC
jgi:hypothetical protein